MPGLPWVNEAAAISAHLITINRPKAAMVMATRALCMQANEPALWTNLGAALYGMRKLDMAEAALVQSYKLYPDHPVTVADMALIAMSRGDRARAYRLIEEAMKLPEADIPSLRWNRALMRLSEGDYLNGFRDYESRLIGKPASYPKLAVPEWQGEHLINSTINVEAEQGVGDVIMWSRFLPLLSKIAKRVTFHPTAAQEPLFKRFGNYIELGASCSKDNPGEADYYCYLASIAHWLKISSPAEIPEDPGCIKCAVEEDGPEIIFPEPHSSPALKVGIAWAGNPLGEQYEEKSVPFELVMTLAQDPRVWLYSLQADEGRHDIAKFGASNFVYDPGEELLDKGFLATGRAILACDIIVTCCTSVAHLAGVLGKPVWVMTAYEAWWPWGLSGDRTPWYPSMRLFRQPKRGDWLSVIGTIQKELAEFDPRSCSSNS